jgi:ribonuclease R
MPRRAPPLKGFGVRSRAPLGKKSALHRIAATAEPGVMPTLEKLREFIQAAGQRVGKTEIAAHFGLNSDQRIELRGMLRELTESGHATPIGRKGLIAHDRLPDMAVVEMTGTDPDGDPIARPVQWDKANGPAPIIFMHREAAGQPALAPGQRVLARLKFIGIGRYEGRTFKRLHSTAPTRILGVFEDGRITPTDRRQKADWRVPANEVNGARPGDIVLAEPLPSGHGLGARPARIIERIGKMGEARAVSLICIHAHGIPDSFPEEAEEEAEAAKGVTKRGREDLRAIPLVTIDGEDARDFDDAVWAEPSEGGWRCLVAIADVAHYVKPDSALDREAWARGNSVYFPDRVVPMLPEALSNGWCSLRPKEDRGCLFVEMNFDKSGTKTSHRFGRGIMKSAARLTYEQVQAARDAGTVPDGVPADLIAHLYGAFDALLADRARRGTLDLDLPERRVLLDAKGQVEAVVPRTRLDSHKLIEEFMVAANVCAAEELERLQQPCMYRVHDRPSDEKLEGLRQFLQSLDLNLPARDRLHPRDFGGILERVKDRPEERLVNEAVLRGQAQAAYDPDNIGHFGLALSRYAHFTSPIRRYADLLVHRALIRGLNLSKGEGGLTDAETARFPDTAEHITSTERRAAAAEREAVDRYLAAFMATRVGELFEARISGVTRFGLFVTVEENGASGIVPLASLPDDRWTLDETGRGLSGRNTGLTFSLGQAVEVRLAEATPRTGAMVFAIMQGDPSATAPRGARSRAGGKRLSKSPARRPSERSSRRQ